MCSECFSGPQSAQWWRSSLPPVAGVQGSLTLSHQGSLTNLGAMEGIESRGGMHLSPDTSPFQPSAEVSPASPPAAPHFENLGKVTPQVRPLVTTALIVPLG